jgi:nitrite reductase/ring-hydroxylating ferredoxin subunit
MQDDKKFLCHKSEIEENKARGFALADDDEQDLFVVRRDDQFYAYRNSCPHTGVSLNWQPDQFMDLDEFYIQCSVHGARFQVEDGLCIWGPCLNLSLPRLELIIEDEKVYLAPGQTG